MRQSSQGNSLRLKGAPGILFPGPDGGTFGYIQRPLSDEEVSTDCGALMGIMGPFRKTYDDACRSIVLAMPADRLLVSVPNEFLQPSWSSHRIKLLIDVERLTDGLVRISVGIEDVEDLLRALTVALDAL